MDITGNGNVLAGLYANLRTMSDVKNEAVSLYNEGAISVVANAENDKAYCIYARLQDTAQQTIIYNSGTIDVTGKTAHALYVSGEQGSGGSSGIGSGGTAHVAVWNMTLQDSASGLQSVFAVADGATLHFGDETGKGSHLILRPGKMSEGYADNNRFSVRDMVNNYGNGAQVTGKIDSVSTPLPMLIASYGDLPPGLDTTFS
ncbi:TPA_asm: hypothetical protein G0D46_23960 [Salmonella enterica subsp. enterica serovar Java]|nr:hypothetical protein [Salmonella enterica subsp. enterica serovar Java]